MRRGVAPRRARVGRALARAWLVGRGGARGWVVGRAGACGWLVGRAGARRRPVRCAVSLVLALDASGAGLSVGLWRDGAVLAHRRETLARGHAERLPPALAAAMHEAGVAFAALDAVAVTT